MAQFNLADLRAVIGVFLQQPVRIAVFPPQCRLGAEDFAGLQMISGEVVNQRQFAHFARRRIVERKRHRRRAQFRHHEAEEQRRMAGSAIDAHAAETVVAGLGERILLDGIGPRDVLFGDEQGFPILVIAVGQLLRHPHGSGEPAATGVQINQVVTSAFRQTVEFGQVAAAHHQRFCAGVGEFPFQHSPRPLAPQQFPAAKRRSRNHSAIRRQNMPGTIQMQSGDGLFKHGHSLIYGRTRRKRRRGLLFFPVLSGG
ncbi:hypothetical protein SDC9_156891 [bioreactor metagenome]|uniref:Uncharacterized protein n=1 Tax=bioreactor metagenome TaxID=1076179 RepID=A0A645F6U0_9ZZZZ